MHTILCILKNASSRISVHKTGFKKQELWSLSHKGCQQKSMHLRGYILFCFTQIKLAIETGGGKYMNVFSSAALIKKENGLSRICTQWLSFIPTNQTCSILVFGLFERKIVSLFLQPPFIFLRNPFPTFLDTFSGLGEKLLKLIAFRHFRSTAIKMIFP